MRGSPAGVGSPQADAGSIGLVHPANPTRSCQAMKTAPLLPTWRVGRLLDRNASSSGLYPAATVEIVGWSNGYIGEPFVTRVAFGNVAPKSFDDVIHTPF